MEQSNVRVKIRVGEVEIEAEGNSNFVENKIRELKKEFFREESAKAITLEAPKGKLTLQESLSEFYTEKKPETHGEMIAVFGYFFENVEGKTEFNHSDILRAYDQTRISKPRNIHDVISKTYKRLGFILPSSKKGFWRLSKIGIEVVESLPIKKGKKNESRL